MLLGVVSYSILEEHGGAFLIAGVAPHGIIELPVVLMCIGMGLRLGHRLIYAILGEKANLVMETKASLRILFRLAMPLLLLAAIIETFITPLAISMVSR
jgi:stage II sporulation protein M